MALPPAYEDHVSGACIRLKETTLLLTGAGWEAADLPGEVLFSGDLALLYALPFQYENDALVPQMVFDDHQKEHTGRELLTFVTKRGHAYPRADVAGIRLTGGEDEIRLRELDLAVPFVVLARSREQVGLPEARIDFCILLDPNASLEARQILLPDDEAAGLPHLLVEHLPCYELHPTRIAEIEDLLDA